MRAVRIDMPEGSVLSIAGHKGSGKSTFCRSLLGLRGPYFREIYVNNTLVNGEHSSLVFNVCDLSHFIPSLSVEENICLSHEKHSDITIDWNKLYADTRGVLADLGIEGIDPGTKLSAVSTEDLYLLNVARGYFRGALFFVMDEISREISESGLERIFALIAVLKERKKNILFVPYRIEELSLISDYVAVTYRGDFVGAIMDMRDATYERILNMMMGYEARTNPFTDVFIEKYSITEREKEIILYIANGLSNNDISLKLDISLGTVKNHIFNVFQKTHVKNRMELCNLLKVK